MEKVIYICLSKISHTDTSKYSITSQTYPVSMGDDAYEVLKDGRGAWRLAGDLVQTVIELRSNQYEQTIYLFNT